MPQPFCELEPETEAETSFVSVAKDGDADRVREVLDRHPELGKKINELWFDFNAPPLTTRNSKLAK